MATKITTKFRDDKVVGLTHSAGNILIQSGSILTVGGLQYEIDAQKSVALPVMTALTRYQVYAVRSGADIILVVSQNENSVGPVGYTSWKLVGSLISLSSLAFGAFINVEGVPTFSISSDEWADNLANGTTLVRLQRKGSNLSVVGTTTMSGAISSGITVTIPNPVTPAEPFTQHVQIGIASLRDAGSQTIDGELFRAGSNALDIYAAGAAGSFVLATNISASSPFVWASGDFVRWEGNWAVSGWLDTPIKDL